MKEKNSSSGCGCGCQAAEPSRMTDPLQEAQELERTADSREQVLRLTGAFCQLAANKPEDYAALWKTGNYHILMGAAYAMNKAEKKYHYNEATRYCEKAMLLDPVFKKKVSDGSAIWEAVDMLGINYIEAMGYWYTARFYYFKECLSAFGRIFHTKLVINNNPVISRIDELDPNWAGGGNYLSRAIFYIAAPEKFGGSKIKAEEEFAKAILAGPNYLVNRWGRAKYLYSLTGNKQGYIEDLKWVIAQDPHNSGNTYPWNVYFQKQSEQMLAKADNLFK